MEMGIAEEYAHKLATDRNMTDIKAMPADEIASVLGVSKDDEIFTGAMNALAELGQRRQKRRSRKITISRKALDDDDMDLAGTKFNVLNHVLSSAPRTSSSRKRGRRVSPLGSSNYRQRNRRIKACKRIAAKDFDYRSSCPSD